MMVRSQPSCAGASAAKKMVHSQIWDPSWQGIKRRASHGVNEARIQGEEVFNSDCDVESYIERDSADAA
jgi:hypothetical protein